MSEGQFDSAVARLMAALVGAGLPSDVDQVINCRFRFVSIDCRHQVELRVVNVSHSDDQFPMVFIDVPRYREVQIECLVWRHGQWQVRPADESTWIPTGYLIPV